MQLEHSGKDSLIEHTWLPISMLLWMCVYVALFPQSCVVCKWYRNRY